MSGLAAEPSSQNRLTERPVRCGPVRLRSTERTYVIARTAFVSSYPPRRCGIATFTRDLAAATGDREIAVLLPPGRGTPFPLEVHHRIRRDERADYAATGRALGACVEAASIQFDYDTWGGDDGEYVFDLVRPSASPRSRRCTRSCGRRHPASARSSRT